jgi:N-acetylglutamate synthase/N-acetylornithine aminotransferase
MQVEAGDRGQEYNALRTQVESAFCAQNVEQMMSTEDLPDAIASALRQELAIQARKPGLEKFDEVHVVCGLKHLVTHVQACGDPVLAQCKVRLDHGPHLDLCVRCNEFSVLLDWGLYALVFA